MYLKSLTLKGFKSFASSTTLQLEPGITCIVGPNGSGKSNVVDALAWVMGEQGAKSLRGGKMEDVIFAGTAGRPPLGRAEVTLTIDNTDGALPIEYAEVSVTRLMFRSGESEYSINGSRCRLVDVQELMSDSGIGRELHVVVGQGQLDAVLSARPEDRRGFIEEAAGILKHRRRKEKTLRKLEAMQTNLTRLSDLAGEIRRQLKPLGRQAEVARKAQSVAGRGRQDGPGGRRLTDGGDSVLAGGAALQERDRGHAESDSDLVQQPAQQIRGDTALTGRGSHNNGDKAVRGRFTAPDQAHHAGFDRLDQVAVVKMTSDEDGAGQAAALDDAEQRQRVIIHRVRHDDDHARLVDERVGDQLCGPLVAAVSRQLRYALIEFGEFAY